MSYSYHFANNGPYKKLHELNAQFDRELKKYSNPNGDTDTGNSSGKLPSVKVWAARIFLAIIFLLLPFFLLIKISIFTYASYSLNGWLALIIGIAATIFLLILYSAYLSYLFNQKIKVHRYVTRGVIILVMSYCCYGLLYLSSVNVKNEELRSQYLALHPILRVTIATATLADADLIITDMERSNEDYIQMGLPPRQQSLHYIQTTGYVHAIDLRTRDRAEWKNWVTMHLLNFMGYTTLRHVGTADHLHVSLPLND